MESLEIKLKSDWKKKLPVYGLYQLHQDSKAGKPLITEPYATGSNTPYVRYQAFSIVAATVGIWYGLSQLFQ